METENLISKLDTQRFGFKVAKVNDFGKEPQKILNELQKLGVKLIITRIQSKEIDTINFLEDLGFRIKDIQSTYRYDIHQEDFYDYQSNPNFAIREGIDNDVSQLVTVVEESFYEYGHYFADKRLDKNLCFEIYKDWVTRSCLDKSVADKVFVAESNSNVIGFLSFKIFEEKEKQYAVGGIGAVSKKHRNHGVFQAIVKKGLSWGAGIGLAWEEHNVLATNFSINRSFSKIGFRIVNTFVTFHCWLDQYNSPLTTPEKGAE